MKDYERLIDELEECVAVKVNGDKLVFPMEFDDGSFHIQLDPDYLDGVITSIGWNVEYVNGVFQCKVPNYGAIEIQTLFARP